MDDVELLNLCTGFYECSLADAFGWASAIVAEVPGLVERAQQAEADAAFARRERDAIGIAIRDLDAEVAALREYIGVIDALRERLSLAEAALTEVFEDPTLALGYGVHEPPFTDDEGVQHPAYSEPVGPWRQKVSTLLGRVASGDAQ